MAHADAAHTKDVTSACVVACDSVGVNIAQSAYIESDVVPKFISSASHSVVCNKLRGL